MATKELVEPAEELVILVEEYEELVKEPEELVVLVVPICHLLLQVAG